MKRYNPKDIEQKWQQAWENQKIYQASEDPKKPKRYVLSISIKSINDISSRTMC